MKYIITESQLSKTKKLVLSKISNWGLLKTIKRFGLTIDTFDKIFEDKMPELTCSDLDDLLKLYVKSGAIKGNKIKEINGVKYSLKNDWDSLNGTNYFKVVNFETREALEGYGTPYWDGNCFLPIDYEVFTYPDKDSYGRYDFHSFETYDLKTEFNSLSEFISYADNEIPDLILNDSIKTFPKIRNKVGL